MASGAEVFTATMSAFDKVSAPLNKIFGAMRNLAARNKLATEQAKAFGGTTQIAFAEAGAAIAATGRAVGKTDEQLKLVGQDAERAGRQIEHAGLGRSWQALGGHVAVARGHFAGLNEGVGRLGGALSGLIPGLGVLGAAGSVVGLLKLIDATATASVKSDALMQSAGLSAGAFATLKVAAGLTETPIEEASSAMGKLNVVLGKIGQGGDKNAAAALRHIGIALRDSNGHARNAGEIFPELADAFSRTTDVSIKLAAAQALFGKAGLGMLPILDLGSAALKKFAAEAKGLTYSVTPDERQGLKDFHTSMLKLHMATGALGKEIGTKLAPVLQPMVDHMTDWVVANREWIATAVVDKVRDLAAVVSRIDFKHVGDLTREWGGHLKWLEDQVGGAHAAIGAFGLAIGSPFIPMIGAGISIVRNLGGAMLWLGRIVWANPIVLAVGAVVFVVGEMIAHWNSAHDVMWNVMNGIRHAVEDMWAIVRPIFEALKSAMEWVNTSKIGEHLGLGTAGTSADGGSVAGASLIAEGGAASDAFGLSGPIVSPYAPAPGERQSPAPVRHDVAVHTTIAFENAPIGMRAQTTTSGASSSQTDVGYSNAGHAGAM